MICPRMKQKTRKDQERREIIRMARRITRRRTTRRKKTIWRWTRPLETREPIGGQRCSSFSGRPWSRAGQVFPLIPKGIKPDIHLEFQIGKLENNSWKTGMSFEKHCGCYLTLWKRTQFVVNGVYTVSFLLICFYSPVCLVACLGLFSNSNPTENVFYQCAVFE